MSTLKELIDNVKADGIVDPEEVTKLRENILADGVIDREEADMLFDLNDAVNGNENSKEYDNFFVSAVSDHVLGDKESPGAIDEDEAAWLIDKIGNDGKVDGVERTLLTTIKARATSMPETLQKFMDDNAI